MQDKIIKNTVKNAEKLTVSDFLDNHTFNSLKDSKKRDVTKIKNSFLKKGFAVPVFVWEKFVIDGTGRKQAMIEMMANGYTFESVPYVLLSANSLAEAKQLALDITSQNGKITDESWEDFTSDFDVDYDTINIQGHTEDLYENPDEKDDDVPNVSADVSLSKLGDLYEIGRHRVLCGDATNLADLEKLMGDKKADMWVTDPPYNVAYEGGTGLTIENDSMGDENFLAFLTDAFTNAVMFLKAGGAYYIWHSDFEGYNFRTAVKKAGLKIRQCLIWKKSSLVMGRQDYQCQHEPCLYGWKDGASHLWNSDRTQTTILEFDKPTKNGAHPTMKPVELIAYQITNNSKGEDIILDNFLGSGTTLIASEKLGRNCYGTELDPKYVDVIISRWVEYTGINKIKKNGVDIIWEIKK